MAIYTEPNASNLGDIANIAKYTNDVSGGGMFLGFMFAIWTIAFIGATLAGRAAYRGFIFANFISAILAAILSLWGVLDNTYMYFFIILLGFGLIWAKLTTSRS